MRYHMNKGGTACKTDVLWMQSFFHGGDGMQIELVKLSDADALQRYEAACQKAHETDILPFRCRYADMNSFLKAQIDWHNSRHLPKGIVPSSLYVCKQEGEIVGTLLLRHELNPFLRQYIGHIGYRVHPLYRKQGIASEMLQQAVILAKQEYGLHAVMVSCRSDNIASRKTIEHAGGIWERRYQVPETNETFDIFWIGGNEND